MSRFVETERIRRVNEPGPPLMTVGGLLNDLRLTRASRDEQRAGIARWLQHHEPLPILREQLKRHGLID